MAARIIKTVWSPAYEIGGDEDCHTLGKLVVEREDRPWDGLR